MKQKGILARYRVPLVALAGLVIFMIAFPELAPKTASSLAGQIKTMLLVVPPIFLLLGLLDVWVPRETMMRFMGAGSGIRGAVIAFALGSAAAGPLYGAFPVAAVLMKKGAGFTNILIFIGAWSTTKVPMFLFETQALGYRFALSRLAIDLVGIVVIAFALKAAIPQKEIDRLYAEAESRAAPSGKK